MHISCGLTFIVLVCLSADVMHPQESHAFGIKVASLTNALSDLATRSLVVNAPVLELGDIVSAAYLLPFSLVLIDFRRSSADREPWKSLIDWNSKDGSIYLR